MLILASQSPRRVQLLKQLDVDFQQIVADIDETVGENESPTDYVMRLAIEKAKAVSASAGNGCWILGADTSVVVDDIILGKPVDLADALSMLSRLSGRSHHVYTAVALLNNRSQHTALVATEVWFKPLTESEMRQYWATGEPQDKAGSYGIQGKAGKFIKKISGSFSAVAGLPLYETAELLKQAGLISE